MVRSCVAIQCVSSSSDSGESCKVNSVAYSAVNHGNGVEACKMGWRLRRKEGAAEESRISPGVGSHTVRNNSSVA